MRGEKTYIHTLKDVSSDVQKKSEAWLIKGSFLRKVKGSYVYLPLGNRVIDKIVKIIGQVCEEEKIYRIQSLEEDDLALIKKEIKTYKDLPMGFYQKVERRKSKIYKNGAILIEIMTVQKDFKKLKDKMSKLDTVFDKINKKCGLFLEKVLDIHKDSNVCVQKYITPSKEGKENMIFCSNCGYKATQTWASCKIEELECEEFLKMEKIHTPNIKSINELESFFSLSKKSFIKTLLLKDYKNIYGILLRGDRELNLCKLESYLGLENRSLTFLSKDDAIKNQTHMGFVGPVGLKDAILIADDEVINMKNSIVGANEVDYHLKNVNIHRDFNVQGVADIKMVNEKDLCKVCGCSLDIEKIKSIGNITMSENDSNSTYIDEEGIVQKASIGKVRINCTHLINSIVENHHNENGILWPCDVAPYHVMITIINPKDEDQMNLSKEIYEELKKLKYEVLVDDRDEKVKNKFIDAQLLGIPIRITIGRDAKKGEVEVTQLQSYEYIKIRKEDIKQYLKG